MITSLAFNLFLFVQLWPASWLYYDGKCGTIKPPSYFTIHGLWPEYNDGECPEYCNKTMKFNITKLNPIKNELSKYWTNFENPEELWAHEFYKHYTCAHYDHIINTTYKYFSAALQMHQQMPIIWWLADQGIFPGKYYSIENMTDAIKLNTTYAPMIYCINTKKGSILNEIRFCLNRNLELRECPNDIKIHHQKHNQCQDGNVYYLTCGSGT